MGKSFIYILIFFSCAGFSQTTSSAEDFIFQLKSGAAVVRLYMNKPKINAYSKSLNNPNVSESEKIKIKKALEQHLQEREEYKIRMIHYIDSIYSFSRVYYIYDYDQRRLQAGERSGFFLDRNGEIDPSITMTEEHYLLFGRGSSDEKIIIYQPNGYAMPSGFPDRYNANFFESIKNIFYRKDRLGKEITKINEKLTKYFDKVND